MRSLSTCRHLVYVGTVRAFTSWMVVLLGASLLWAIGCAGPKFSPVNLEDSGWHVTHNQAVWKPGKDAPEIAGDLLIATNQAGRCFISFSKTLPLITAQAGPEGWRIEAPENRTFAAAGKPSSRIVWFQIVPALTGYPAKKPWKTVFSEGNVQIINQKSGETLEVYPSN